MCDTTMVEADPTATIIIHAMLAMLNVIWNALDDTAPNESARIVVVMNALASSII